MSFSHQKIADIVSNNPKTASVLHFLGIHFYNYTEQTLEQVCIAKGLNVETVSYKIENTIQQNKEEKISLVEFPVDLIIEYLKHWHFIFVKERIPYLSDLLFNLDHDIYPEINELKLVFPHFVEDFIEHIYEEEDQLFYYILQLNNALKGALNMYKTNKLLEQKAIQEFALEHDIEDDEMKGIRKLTNNYTMPDTRNLQVKVLLSELQSFEQELKIHARVENELLFPKALFVEQEVNNMLKSKAGMN